MTTLSAIRFPNADEAGIALDQIISLQMPQPITLKDAVIISWPEGKRNPKTRQMASTTGAGALQGSFWGMLFGLIFFIPFFGLAVESAMGALSEWFADFGIDAAFIHKVRELVTEGTSALFLLTSGAEIDQLPDVFKDKDFEIIATNLSKQQEEQLLDAFSAAE
jgi:uncharacterized membrane protein